MKTALLLALTLILSSCGKSSSPNSGKGQDPSTCKSALIGSLCMASIPWTITSSSVNFPKNFKLKMMGDFEVDTCKRKDFFKLSQKDGKTDIKFKFVMIPERSFPVEIIDRGANCDNNAIFHSEDNVVYGVAEISINGRVRERSVSVFLNN
jgi:hypothetical protein